jgi:hypothetical protein
VPEWGDCLTLGGWLLALTPEALHNSAHTTTLSLHVWHWIGHPAPPLTCLLLPSLGFAVLGVCACLLVFGGTLTALACFQASLPRVPSRLTLGGSPVLLSTHGPGFQTGFVPPCIYSVPAGLACLSHLNCVSCSLPSFGPLLPPLSLQGSGWTPAAL